MRHAMGQWVDRFSIGKTQIASRIKFIHFDSVCTPVAKAVTQDVRITYRVVALLRCMRNVSFDSNNFPAVAASCD